MLDPTFQLSGVPYVFEWIPLCWQRQERKIAGQTFIEAAGVRYSLTTTWDCSLPTDTLIQGHLCRMTVFDSYSDIFYRSGRIRAVALAQDEEIDGVTCISSQNLLRMGNRALFCCGWMHALGSMKTAASDRGWCHATAPSRDESFNRVTSSS